MVYLLFNLAAAKDFGNYGHRLNNFLSQGAEEKVSVDVLQAVPPVEHPVAARDLSHPLHHQLDHRPKISKQ